MVRDGVDRRVPVEQVVVGDLVRLAAGDQVVADGTVVSADGLALDEANLTGESELGRARPRGAGVVGLVRGRGGRAVRGDGGGPGQPRRATDRDRARVSSPALSARAGQRSAVAVADRARGPARDRADGLGLRPPRVRQRSRAGRHRRDRQPRPRGTDPADQRHRGGVGVQDGPARRARAAAQRDRVARLGRHRLHRQDGHADRADAAGGRRWCPRRGEDETSLARELASYAASAPSRNLDARGDRGRPAGGGRARAGSSLRCRSPRGVAGARSISATSGSCWARPERFADADPALVGARA